MSFRRGFTQAGTTKTIDTTTPSYGTSVGMEGQHVVDKDTYGPNAGVTDHTMLRSAQDVRLIAVRNTSGITLLPGLAVVWESGQRGKRVDGYSFAPPADGQDNTGEIAGVVDDHLPMSTGVRNGDLFWLQVGGPCLQRSHVTPASAQVRAEGDLLIAVTAAASTATTTGGTEEDESGRAVPWDGAISVTAATDGTAVNIIKSAYARAVSAAATSGVTNEMLLIDLNVLFS